MMELLYFVGGMVVAVALLFVMIKIHKSRRPQYNFYGVRVEVGALGEGKIVDSLYHEDIQCWYYRVYLYDHKQMIWIERAHLTLI